LTVTGGVTATLINSTQVLAGSLTISNGGTAGTTNYVYQVVGLNSAGVALTAPYPSGNTNTGNATLTGTNLNTITWTAVDGAATYNIYRTTSYGTPSSTGLIGNTASLTFNDTGIAATGSIPTSTVNEVSYTGGVGTSTPAYAVKGNYMYVTGPATNALNIFDIASNPFSPSLVGTIAGNASTDIAVVGIYAYVTSSNSDTMQIFNISNPASPSLVSTTTVANGTPASIAVSGNYAYIPTSSTNYLDIYNISVPATPSLTGSVAIGNWMGKVSIANNVAYVSLGNNPFSIQAINVSTPATPFIMSSLSGFGYNGIPDDSQVIDGKYLTNIVMNGGQANYIKVDISNPYSMQIVSNLVLGNSGSSGAVFSGRYVYQAVQNNNPGDMDAFKIFDVSSGSATLLSSTLTRHFEVTTYVNGRYAYIIGSSYIQVYDIGGDLAQSSRINSASISELSVTSSAGFNGDVGIQGALTVAGVLRASGAVVFQNTTNSTTAFDVQNAAGATILSADTTNNRVNINGDLNLVQVSAPASAPTVATGTAGSLTGTYYYVVTYITANGETNYGPASSSVSPSSQQVNLTSIPVSSSGLVTGRKIYRGTSASGPFSLTATINDNTTTSQSDNNTTPSGSPPTANKTASLMFNGVPILRADSGNGNQSISLGWLANNNNVGTSNTAIGWQSLYQNTASGNTALGDSALRNVIGGSNNVGVGKDTGTNLSSGSNNTALGNNAQAGSTGSYNTSVGNSAGNAIQTGDGNTALGYRAFNLDSNGFFASSNGLQNATAIGAYTQVQQSNSIVLGSPDLGTKVGVGITIPNNTFSVSPLDYQTGTATRTNSSATLTGTGTTWTNAMVGDILIFADGTTRTITGFTSTTSLTMSSAWGGTTDASPVRYRLHKIGLQVSSTGNVGLGTVSPSALLDVNGTLNVVGLATFASSITVNGHIISGGSAPTIAAGTAACTTPTVSVAGKDTAGLITITTGTGCAGTGKLATITFNTAFGAAPRVTLTPATSNAVGLGSYVDSGTISTTTFDLGIISATPANSTTYKWYYHVIQ
jgi:hypothetical protein